MNATYFPIRELGKGAFGTVFDAKSSASGTHFAVKVARGKHNRDVLSKEAQIHSRMVHPNILQFVTSFESENCSQEKGIVPLPLGSRGNCSVMVIELCTGNTLSARLKTGLPSLDQINLWGYEIASGLLYLKEQGVIHRDIKPDNILFCNNTAKISDFGLADYYEDLLTTAGTVGGNFGTPYFMSLEAFGNIFDYSTDIFAFGVVLYLMYANRYPYPGKNLGQLRESLRKQIPHFQGIKREEKDRNLDLETLILRMINRDSTKRPQINEVLSHPFFEQKELDATVIMEEGDSFDDDEDDMPMSLDDFKKHRMEFGNGTREQFYMYLANLHPFMTPMSMQIFTRMWEKATAN